MDLLKELHCDLAKCLEFAKPCGYDKSGTELIDEEFVCCCERARHAIKDFSNRGNEGKVSDCFPVALDALRDLQWCLGQIYVHACEELEIATDLNIGMLRLDLTLLVQYYLDAESDALKNFIKQWLDRSFFIEKPAHALSKLELFLLIWPSKVGPIKSFKELAVAVDMTIRSQPRHRKRLEIIRNTLLTFDQIEMYHIRKGRVPTLLNSLYSLGLPKSSLDQEGPSVSYCWDSRDGPSSARLPPGLNVDEIGKIQYFDTLGEGAQGVVYSALWGGQRVAVKEVGFGTRCEGLEALESVIRSAGRDSVSSSNPYVELDVLKTLNHPNIVQLNGYTLKPIAAGSYGLVMELMEGSLWDLILNSGELSDLVKVDTLLQVARGMQFLHRVGIMHRDLKPANILIKQLTYLPLDARRLRYVVAKLADFGLSKVLSKPEHLAVDNKADWHTYKQGTSFYMAPEVRMSSNDADQSEYAMPADVFSFGTTCFNMLTGEETPFVQKGHPLKVQEFYGRIAKEDLDPFVIEYRPSTIALLVTRCWCLDPRDRPEFFEICQILEDEKRKILCTSTIASQRSMG